MKRAMSAILTDDMIATIRRAALAFVATVNVDGSPNAAPAASLAVHGGALVFANMAAAATVANLRRNPSVAIAAVEVFRRRGFRFGGRASIRPPGTADYEAVAARVRRVNGPKYPVHEAVKVEVEWARPVLSPAYILGAAAEDEVEAAFFKRYGVRPLEGG